MKNFTSLVGGSIHNEIGVQGDTMVEQQQTNEKCPVERMTMAKSGLSREPMMVTCGSTFATVPQVKIAGKAIKILQTKEQNAQSKSQRYCQSQRKS